MFESSDFIASNGIAGLTAQRVLSVLREAGFLLRAPKKEERLRQPRWAYRRAEDREAFQSACMRHKRASSSQTSL